MKLLMLTGAFLGFGIGVGFSWAQRSAWPDVLWRAGVAAYLGGLLLRWWGRLWMKGLREVCEARMAEAARAKTIPNPAKS
jgi:hypothetical protein